MLTNYAVFSESGDRCCHGFAHDHQSTWKNFDSFSSEYKSVLNDLLSSVV
ncbi:hypothetical protein COO91_00497 [Nostoc flagelliforme CCNUN1]|uniref:Uncharacterized protein n=1 Tax=Nostoc flagelliforme CCNUN1 TaxID=2038116 RepID=A0A2K8SGV3_9NOSO|nr:hypothetical protein [Nostoc flagelliforme]AUB34668.1 hypothetical protein COO91_00497 [Nostoc flagelliforme CCNUN1]